MRKGVKRVKQNIREKRMVKNKAGPAKEGFHLLKEGFFTCQWKDGVVQGGTGFRNNPPVLK